MTQESDFGKRLELTRRWLGLTQEQAGVLLQCPKSTIGSYEALTRFPSTKQVRRFAEVLGVPFLWLCGWGPTFSFEVGHILAEHTKENDTIEETHKAGPEDAGRHNPAE